MSRTFTSKVEAKSWLDGEGGHESRGSILGKPVVWVHIRAAKRHAAPDDDSQGEWDAAYVMACQDLFDALEENPALADF